MKSTSKPHKKMSDLTYNSQASLIFFVLFCTLLCQSAFYLCLIIRRPPFCTFGQFFLPFAPQGGPYFISQD
jgi:hypothetical protein